MDLEENSLIIVPNVKPNLEFQISQQIQHHTQCLRTLDSTKGSTVITGAYDRTCGFFMKENGKYFFVNDSKLHTDFIYKVLTLKNQKGYLTASKDRTIIQIDNDGNIVMEYVGHEGAVNSLSQSAENSFISGSWDGTAKIWNINTGECAHTLKDHSYAVAVLALPNNIYITGSQDRRLRFWKDGSNTKNIEDAHEDIIRDISPSYSEVEKFYTASNDSKIKQWNLLGQNLITLTGHEGYIFRVVSWNDFLFTGGDDKILKVWYKHKFTQDLFHPNTVWDCNINEDGDLLSACGDGVLRVFSNDPSKWLSPKEIEEYNTFSLSEGSKSETEKAKDSGLNVNQLKPISYMNTYKGKEGEIRPFNNNGKGEVWMVKDGKWEKVGDVIGGEDQGNQTSNLENTNTNTNTISQGIKFYPGDKIFPAGEYDFIFDVELQGRTTQIPFMHDGNKLLTAEKFCKREGLHAAYKEDIIKFLKAHGSVKPVKPNNQNVFTNYHAESLLDKVKLPIVNFLLRPLIVFLIQ